MKLSHDAHARILTGIFLALILTIGALDCRAADSFPDVSQLPSRSEIPNPLVMSNGTKVTTSAQWSNQRRPELKELFQHYMYGSMPPAPTHFDFNIQRVDHNLFGGKAKKEEVTIRFSEASNAPAIHLLLIVPIHKPRASTNERGCAVFLGMNFCGNHMLLTNDDIGLPDAWLPKNCPGCVSNHATDVGRGAQVNVWNVEQTIDRGYALANFYCGDIEPDSTNSTTGLRAFLAGQAAAGKNPASDCAALMAWAWGCSRAVDYLVTDGDIDPKRIAVVGHSRLGKAAVLAAAMDERIAMAIPLQAGCGGTAPSRTKIGETVTAINTHFPHWFNDNFKKFNDQPDRLPFDQNCLIAMVAPRPVLLGAATEDTWGNPDGVFQMAQAADPVYQLLGVPGLSTKQMPGENQLVGGRLAYFIRPGKHSMTKADWRVFLDFADREMP